MTSTPLSLLDASILREFESEVNARLRAECEVLIQPVEILYAQMLEAYINKTYRVPTATPILSMRLCADIHKGSQRLCVVRKAIADVTVETIEAVIAHIVYITDVAHFVYSTLLVNSRLVSDAHAYTNICLPLISDTAVVSQFSADDLVQIYSREFEVKQMEQEHPPALPDSIPSALRTRIIDHIWQLARTLEVRARTRARDRPCPALWVASCVCRRVHKHMNTFVGSGLLVARAINAVSEVGRAIQ